MGKWTECMCEALLRCPPSKPFHALEHLFLLCCGCSAFWPARFSTSSRPIVIVRLISFRLVLQDRFFFIFVFSHFLFSLPRNAFTFAVLLGNPCKTYQHQSVGKRWNESPFSLPAEQLAHPNMYTQEVLTILKVLAEYRLALWRSTEKHDESSALATQCETSCATRLSYHGICTILRAIRTIYVIRKGPIFTIFSVFAHFLTVFYIFSKINPVRPCFVVSFNSPQYSAHQKSLI